MLVNEQTKFESVVEDIKIGNEIIIPGTATSSIFVNDKPNVNFKKGCYSCKPRGTVKEHIISKTPEYVFNHDLFRRPMVIVTSVNHYQSIYDIPPESITNLFSDIKLFIDFWNLSEYQIIINGGKNQHFHIKIKISPDVANRLRRDHFERIRLEKNYHTVS